MAVSQYHVLFCFYLFLISHNVKTGRINYTLYYVHVSISCNSCFFVMEINASQRFLYARVVVSTNITFSVVSAK